MLRISSFLLLLMVACTTYAQGYTGSWKGRLDIGPGLRIIFHITESSPGTLVSTADSPDQNARGLKCDTTYINSTGIHIEMRKLRAAFAGKLEGDTVIDGTFTQGAPIPLRLTRSVNDESPRRPQEPMPPFPYRSEDLVFSSKTTGLDYGATLSIPPGKGPFPAVVLITGSGQQDRNYELMGHRPFAVLADQLARKGVAVLRVDDRGKGKSTGDFSRSTSQDFAADVSASLDFLLTRPEIKKSALGLVGHSEGGMIAPIVAAGRNDLRFVVLLAAPGVPISQLMTEQSSAILRSSGVGDSAIAVYAPFYRVLMKTLTTGTDSATAVRSAREYMENWAATADTAALRELQLGSPMARLSMFRTLAAVARNPWFRYFMAYDPAPFLEKMKMKVLALNGDKDVQVLPASNMKGIRDALEKGGNRHFETEILPGLNHLFQTCTRCTVAEYSELEETFSPVALKKITDWIVKATM
ncbi:MAG: alpha/beta hydrolase [Chitinophagaceae bacterium]|nr:MAG: alpha/beta hydrolase [Chitinophagaceae bacterium]